MPFTFCHPAIVLPLAKLSKSKISMTALVIGSMSPDFEYFIRMRMERVHGHSIAGMFYYNLPLTIILAFIFHFLVRDALIRNLPKLFRESFDSYIGFNWIAWFKKKWYVFLYSALIGSFSHIFWDAFTHSDGFFVERFSFLQGKIEIFGKNITKAEFAQLASTLIGAIFIGAAILWPQRQKIRKLVFNSQNIYWLLIVLITCTVVYLRKIEFAGDYIATTISGGLIGLIIVPKLMRFINFKRNVNQ